MIIWFSIKASYQAFRDVLEDLPGNVSIPDVDINRESFGIGLHSKNWKNQSFEFQNSNLVMNK